MAPTSVAETRILTLDGVRAIATISVVLSHYVGEVPHGITAFATGAIAVDVFFVLSGFLIGRQSLINRDAANFYQVFYARRFLRTIPSYLLVMAIVITALFVTGNLSGAEPVPWWSYFVFVQNFFMASHGSIGVEWLLPTWTLAVEEQFYLIAPTIIIFLPARFVVPVAAAVFALATGYRLQMAATGVSPSHFLPLLVARADALAAGVIVAALWFRLRTDRRFDKILEIAPLAILVGFFVAGLAFGTEGLTATWFHTVIALAGAAFILRATVTPEAVRWLEARWLRFFADNSYSIYLVHLPIGAAVHGVLLDTHPDIGSPAGIGATLLAIGLTLIAGRALKAFVEEPLTAIGRRLKWRHDRPAVASFTPMPEGPPERP
jgi:peptidoglycan/LPS O-acetylase OafA/YrhL